MPKTTAESTYATKTALNQTASEISTEVSKKVNNSEFSTKITQNAYSVRVAWNNNSNYIQLESAKLVIYNGSVSKAEKRASFDENGNHFYRDGYYVGKIGTNQLASDLSKRGLNFDLEYQGSYMTWAAEESSSEFTLLCKSIDKALNAAENANNSAQNADEVTSRTNTAATKADQASTKANTAAQSATEAAEAANVAKDELLSQKYIKGITGNGTVIQPSSQQIVNITPANIGAVPTTRTVNGKALSSNITLGASDVGALPDTTAIPGKTSELENDSKFIDNKATGSTSIAIGATSTQNYSTIIGTESSCTGQYSTAVGRKSVSVQYGSKANGNYSVALGYNSSTALSGVVSVGDGSTNSSYGTRRIINVKDPVNAQDAATKNYVDTQMAENGGGVEVVQNTGNSETSVMSQKAVTDSIANIGIDTTNSMLSLNSTKWINYYADKKNLYNVHDPDSLQIASSNGSTVAFAISKYVSSSYKDAWRMYTLTYPSTYSVLNSPKFQKQQIKGIEYPYNKTWFLTSSNTEYSLINSSEDLLYTGTITNGIVSDTVTSQSVALPIKSHNMSFIKVGGRFFLKESVNGSFSLYTSSDGINWVDTNGEMASCYDIKAYNNAFYICEVHGIYRSTDGVNWEKVFTSASIVYTLFYNSNTYTAFVSSDQIATSADGINWTLSNVNNKVGITLGKSKTVYDYSKNQYACIKDGNLYYLDSTLTWVLSEENSLSNVKNNIYLVSDSTSMVALTFYSGLTYKFSLLYTGENPSCILNVSNGGTGATTSENARANLSLYSKSEVDQKIKGYITYSPVKSRYIHTKGNKRSFTMDIIISNFARHSL